MINKAPFFFLVFLMVSCATSKVEKSESLSPCHSTMNFFFQCNFDNWQPLEDCTLKDIGTYFPDWESIPSRNYHAGSSYTNNVIKLLRRSEDRAPKEIWHTVENSIFTKIVVEYPAVKEIKKLITQLGVPDLKLDYYLDVLLYEKKEWVYLDEGLTLRLGTNNEILWEMQLFVPTTKEHYMAEIHQSEQAREFLYKE